jgi:hypothetical protein
MLVSSTSPDVSRSVGRSDASAAVGQGTGMGHGSAVRREDAGLTQWAGRPLPEPYGQTTSVKDVRTAQGNDAVTCAHTVESNAAVVA